MKFSWDRLVLEYSGTVKEKSLGLKERLVIINFSEYLMCFIEIFGSVCEKQEQKVHNYVNIPFKTQSLQ